MADGWVLGDRYRVQDRLGSGGMAEVFRARDELLDRAVAVKVFRATHVAADAPAGVARQQTELQALARLNHPNLITLYDGSITSTPAYLVMELIEGPSLGARIAQGPLSEPEVREIGAQLADGLAYVHSQGMVHRDVKPENILLGIDRSGEDSTVRARLSDFGIVRLLGAERMTSADFTLGTASYLAPEQARGSGVDPPADVYSLALVLVEALTGRRSFEGPPLEAAMARLSNRPSIPSSLPAPWPRLLFAMTELDPLARPTAAQVARALRTTAGETTAFIPAAGGGTAAAATQLIAPVPGVPATRPGPPMPPVAPRPVSGPNTLPPDDGPRSNGLLITAGVLALVVIIAGIVLAIILSGSGDSPSGGASTTPSTSPSKSAKSATKSSSTAQSSRAPSSPASTSKSTSGSSSSDSPSAGSSTSKAPSSSAPATSSPPPSSKSVPSTSKPASTTPSTSKSDATSSTAGALTKPSDTTSATSAPPSSPAVEPTP